MSIDETRSLRKIRIHSRHTALDRLYGGTGEPVSTITATNERTNGYFADEVTLKVQAYLESGLMASARNMLLRYHPGQFGRLSAFETAQKQEFLLLESKLCRLEGQFAAALPPLTSCMRHY